ncbi:SUKH-4 family immunity protein [Streptomyces sp. H27-D2]|uniref:SUKH-4 family immunity protein n=1 Tax=Streptomyces sp. H27-D2 TaxID=3046304 RepID=UPI002DBC6BB9|nr:SUKH-4 family immunity protein [Streptomyces sp. H27-D2]MEC4018294.1 SUKH-4 family immunity protein [Streptomyces sp. H27-D2]
MNYAVSTDDIIRLFGVQGIVFFPREEHSTASGESPSMRFLHEVGLPHDDVFLSRVDTADTGQDSVLLGEALSRQERPYPAAAERWLILGYFLDSFLALDPASERVYAFPEGTNRYFPVHRNVESLVHALCALQDFQLARDSVEDKQALAGELRSKIGNFDDLPFVDPLSEWNIIYEEIIEGAW